MREVLYIGPRSPLAEAAAVLVREAEHEFASLRAHEALRRICASDCGVVVLCWRPGQGTPALAKAARERSIPVIVITSRLVDAFRAFNSLADIFLEQPASPQEIATLAVELISRRERNESGQALVAATAA